MGYLLFAFYSLFFLFFQTKTIYGGDGGDFAAAAVSGGFAHAPGYPFYSMVSYLLTHIPYSTPAWRIGLLSSIPAAITLTLIYLIIKKQTSSIFAGIIASATLGVTYVFWLYSIVPEVFILSICLSTAIFYCLYEWSISHKQRLIYLAVLLFGLSVAHHHIVAFMIPSYAYIILLNKKHLPKKTFKSMLTLAICFCIGIASYMWLPITTFFVSAHTWGDPVTFGKLMKVVTRAYYGTFIAAQNYNQSITERLNQIPILFGFYVQDFLLPTILIAVLGAIRLYKKNKHIFIYIVLAFLFTGPLFFTYASYKYVTPYEIAVAERFLLPSYVMITILFGHGIAFTEILLRRALKNLKPEIAILIACLFILIPLRIGLYNYFRLGVLKNDLTAEHFAEDLLHTKSKDKKAVFLLQNDNTVFNTQYLHQWKKDEYADAIPLNPAELTNGFSIKMIQKYYPDIKLPNNKTLHPIADFIKKNYDKYEIYADLPDDYANLKGISDGKWLPNGLIYRYYSKGDEPNVQELLKINNDFWKVYHNPFNESLKEYGNLQLEHVLEFYQFARVRSAIVALEAGNNKNALHHLDEYRKLKPTSNLKLAQVDASLAYISLNKCNEAKEIIKNTTRYEKDEYYKMMIAYHRGCTKDQDKIKLWEKNYGDFLMRKQQILQKL